LNDEQGFQALTGSGGYRGSIETGSPYGITLNSETSDHLKFTPFAFQNFIETGALNQNHVIIFIRRTFVNHFLPGHFFSLFQGACGADVWRVLDAGCLAMSTKCFNFK